jgi:hypothetical protein
MFFCKEHFLHVSDPDLAKQLLKQTLQSIEIEIHSFCNRTCSFCTNSIIDRRHNRVVMDPALYSKIIDDLAQIDYEGSVGYSRYIEPTSDRPLFLERLRETRAKLPKAKLQTFTNGDYLTAEYIEALRDAGLNSLIMMVYLPNGKERTDANYLNAMVSRLFNLALPWEFVQRNLAVINVPGIEVFCRFEDFETSGTNRGGALQSGQVIERESPCVVPFRGIYIDNNGSMMPCCDIRSDYENHKNCVAYVLTPENSIFEGYANSALVEWRRHIIRFGTKHFPCNCCTRENFANTKELHDVFDNLAAVADAMALSEAKQTTDAAA